MRILWVALALSLAACGDHVAAGDARPSPTRTPIPWTSARAIPTPLATPAAPRPPTNVRTCAASDVAALVGRGQGATGWWVRGVFLGNRSDTTCLISGPTAVAYVDAHGGAMPAAGVTATSYVEPGWAVLAPASVPSDEYVHAAGQAQVILWSLGDCDHRELRSVAITFGGSTGTVRVATGPPTQTFGGRCDFAGQRFGLSSSPIRPMETPPLPTPTPLPVTFGIDAPAVAFAGETLRYVVTVKNLGAQPFAWSACPVYVEWLGGREVTPSDVPGRAPKPPDRVYAGFSKELHSLNCDAAGPIAAGATVEFEMLIAVPRDGLGPDSLRWELAGPFPAAQLSSPIRILAPRR